MKETHYKLKHRVTALFAAAVMLCSMLPGAAFAEEPTPQPTEETVQMEQQTEPSETDNGQTDESSPDPGEGVTEATPETAEEQPAEEEISAAVVGAELYTDLPDAPIGSYIGSEGLPVATGETKIGIRVQGLPYGTYLVVETTVPHDLFQAEPFIVTVDPEQDNNPWGAMATPKDSVMTGSDSYQKFTVLDEEIEVYLRITKVDEETGKPVLLPDTAFQIYWLDEQGHYRYDSNGNPKLVTMTDTVNGHLTKDVDTFYTNSEGILTLPEKLPLGKYRIVEVTGPNGFYNEWLDSAGYENGILTDDADGIYYVDFEITTDRIYAATGDKNENGMDTLVIGENYSNHETLGKLTIRKTGEVLAGWKTEVGALDPWMTGEAEDGNFVYETRPLAGAEYTITAAEDIYTQDRQTDNYGNRTLWYAKGDVVAVVTTGDGSADIAAFAPARTKATYDFLSVIHDGTIGEVSVTLPLGSYHIEETKPPYGYIGTTESYDVTFAWDNELNDVVMATSIAKVDGAASSQSFEVVRSKDANADFIEQQTLKFYNDREKAKVGVYKVDRETGKYLAGAVFNLYTADDIYSVDGKLLFAAGELVATSPETGADGYTYFDCDIPIRGEYYGSSIRKDATTNSGNYIVKELRAPLGYYVNEEPMEVTFTYDGQAIMVLDNTCANKPTEMWVSKRDLTNDEELPGATLAIKDMDGNTVTTWVSTDEPHRVTGLHFGESYTLTEIRAADGYALANDITFRLIQKSDEDGNHLEECEVYYLTTKIMPAFADDPLTTINNLSDFVFSAIKAIGAILLGFGIVQIGLALKGHDASQRAQGFMTFFGGVVIYFAKDILDMIL